MLYERSGRGSGHASGTGKFGSEEFNAAAPVHNAYIYTDRTTEANMRKEEEKPDTIHQLLDFLKTHYDFRRNIIMDRLEYLDFNEKTENG